MLYTAFLECATPHWAGTIKDRYFRGTETLGLRVKQYVMRDRFLWVTIRGSYKRIYNRLMDFAYEQGGKVAFIGLSSQSGSSDPCNLNIIENAKYWRTDLCHSLEQKLIANFITLPKLSSEQFEEIVGACCIGADHYNSKAAIVDAYEFQEDDVHPLHYWECKFTPTYSFETERLFVSDGYNTLARVMAHCIYLAERETIPERIGNMLRNMMGGEKRATVL